MFSRGVKTTRSASHAFCASAATMFALASLKIPIGGAY